MQELARQYNVPPTVVEEIRVLAGKYAVDRVILFGSRARGSHRQKSDIDLAVQGGNFLEFTYDVDETTSTLLCYDFVDMSRPISSELEAEIKSDGVVLYEKVR